METGLEARALVLNTDAPEATLWVYSQVLVIPKIPSLLPNRGRKSQSLVPGVVNTPVNPSSTTTYFQSVFWEIFSLTRYTSTWTLQLQSWVCEWSYGTLFHQASISLDSAFHAVACLPMLRQLLSQPRQSQGCQGKAHGGN